VNIELDNLIEVLALYNITEHISNFCFFINGYNKKTSEMKVITKVEFLNRKPLVVKFVREGNHPHNIIENQSAFSEYLRSQGILTPKRYMSGGSYCLKYDLNNFCIDVTVEDYLGEEIKAIDFKLAYKIGQLMGRIHRISEKGNCYIGSNTIFNIVGYNEVSGFNSFLELGEGSRIDQTMYQKIKTLYEAKLDKIKLIWPKLPKYATQGDISINNLSFVGGEIGIFDYNIAGDETLIGDMVLEGLLTSYEMNLSFGLSDTNRPELFRCFFNGYISERPLTDDEKSVLNEIYSISSALWFTKIKYDENSLVKLVERNDDEKVDLLLREIYHTLCEELIAN
jgi:Ser/Thr protein kinase RdoA (MazF antagonist)